MESELFFPWLESRLPKFALGYVHDVKKQHKVVKALSIDLHDLCQAYEINRDQQTLHNILETLQSMSECEHCIKHIQVPLC